MFGVCEISKDIVAGVVVFCSWVVWDVVGSGWGWGEGSVCVEGRE